ncbi:MAG: AbrB/MazE/SpoVT family DNA-binding domain-containing protein [Pseudomonadota bacterium]
MTYYAKVIAGGKIVIPADLRREFGIKDGDSVAVERSGDGLTIKRSNPDAALQRIREKMKGYSVDQFLAERRQDWGE